MVNTYGVSLDLQISQQGSCLPNSDEELLEQVSAMLRDGPAEEMHCLGLDPLLVMEDALTWAAGRPARPRARLRGLAKAFKVLEHAALNLYVCPWRKEYKIIKTYSSVFIHDICPVLPPPQVGSLFGLLGYRAASSRPEQLRLMSPRDGPASPDHLLRLSCAFFLARCECRLLLAALEKHGGELEWELSLVRERRRGHVLQVSLDNTTQRLDVGPSLKDMLDGEVDLYGDDELSQRTPALSERHDPRAAASEGPGAASNGEAAAASSPTGGSERRACGEFRSDRVEVQDGEPGRLLALGGRYIQYCSDCDSTHDAHFTPLAVCKLQDPHVEALGSPQSDLAVSSMTAHPQPHSISPTVQPIRFHGCCDVTSPDPHLLCHSCHVFHSDSCRDGDECLSQHHARVLGVCACGEKSSRTPRVFCRYCGNEYCRTCWYRNPIKCVCGQTFDQSTPV